MRLLLPPSETKRGGGASGTSLDLDRLSFPSLRAARRTVLAELRALGSNRATMAAALKLGPSQAFEIERNREVRTSPVMPAIDRFDGVLYEALDAPGLSAEAREFASVSLVIHSALFGLLGALDPVPAYRLSHDSKLPKRSLKSIWPTPISAALAQEVGLLLDLRSEAYASLGPAPQREGSYYLRVVARDGAGTKRALNHFNKKGKGAFVRAVLHSGVDHPDASSLLDWARGAGIELSHGAPGELELVVAQ